MSKRDFILEKNKDYVLLSTVYDANFNGAGIKLLDVEEGKIVYTTDPFHHEPYCLSRESLNQIRNRNIPQSTVKKITSIEKDSNQRFRFLPVKMLEISYNPEDRFSIKILNENYGGYPCCGYIDPSEFKGILTDSLIIGLWKI